MSAPGKCRECPSTDVTYYATQAGTQHAGNTSFALTGWGVKFYGPLCDTHAGAVGLNPTAFGRPLTIKAGAS